MADQTKRSPLQSFLRILKAPPTWRELLLFGFLLLELFWVVNGQRPRMVIVVPDPLEVARTIT